MQFLSKNQSLSLFTVSKLHLKLIYLHIKFAFEDVKLLSCSNFQLWQCYGDDDDCDDDDNNYSLQACAGVQKITLFTFQADMSVRKSRAATKDDHNFGYSSYSLGLKLLS